MEDIKDIINSIVKGSAKAGVKASEVLAAFVARTVCDMTAFTFRLVNKMILNVCSSCVITR